MANVIILGGGFGGVAAARRLRDQLPAEHQVTLIDRRDYYMIGFRKTWGILGEAPLSEGQRKLSELRKFGINIVQGDIESIDPAGPSVRISGGMQIDGDYMIVALGAELATDAVPGFSEHALNVYDPALVPANAAAIRAFQGGRVLVGVFGLPYKCPPAPYELAILLKEKLAAMQVPAEISVFTPLPSSLPILEAQDCATLDGYMAKHGIRFEAGKSASRADAGRVEFKDGSAMEYDLLLGIAPHRAPRVVRESGLTGESGWIQINARTLETAFPNVFAIGDVTAVKMANGSPLPKAGVFAEGAGMVAADRIAAVLGGREPQAQFEGRGGCFLEVGDGRAVLVQGHFMAEGSPQVEMTPATEAYVEEKWAFERERLVGWFD